MTIAIIDLGTNTFNLLIGEVSSAAFNMLYQAKISVKLGEGGINKNYILPEAMNRGIAALKEYKSIIEKYKAEKVKALATSAIREASNGTDFIKRAKAETGIEPQIISGGKEAEYIYYGVRDAVKMGEELSLVMDIGGGSTEFIIANKNGIVWKQSFLLGVARLLEKFKPSDPIKESEIKLVEDHLRKNLSSLLEAASKYKVTELIGSSGSFDSLAEMIAWKFYSSPGILEGLTEYDFDLHQCEAIYKQVLASTHAERLTMKGLISMRVDMIVLSSVLVNFVVRELHLEKMRLSTFSLKEGVLWEMRKDLERK